MAQAQALINTLKHALRENKLTYADVATGLDMSEANVKRMFSSKRFTLDRIEEICQLMQMEITDLIQKYESSRTQITHLSYEQEKKLVSDTKLLLIAVCVRNHWTFEDILETYNIPDTESIQLLAVLDRLKIIDLLPKNRIKLRVSEDFRWLPDGPIEKFFEKQVQNEFLKSRFHKDAESRLFLSGALSDSAVLILKRKLDELSHEFSGLHRKDMELPAAKRNNIGLLLAMRPWELAAFQNLRR